MYNKRNTGALIISCFAAISALAGCGNSNAGGTTANTSAPAQTTTTTAADTKKSDTAAPHNTESEKPLKVVTTIFPEYDWVKQIMGDRAANAEITYLLESGIDLHNYQPTADDIIRISDCDLFVYVGGESDGWVEDAVAGAVNKDMKVINLMETMGDKAKLEEVKEGMQHDHDHDHGHEEEIEAEDIKDRTLAEFDGEWKSLLPVLNAGDLDGFLAEEAEEHGEPVDEVRGEYAEKWACNAVGIKVDGSTITFTFDDGTTASAEYAYAGYSTVLADDGDIKGVRYQFETESADAPRYVQFNDHGHEPADEVEHFHVYFGSDSFDALMNSSANPFFVHKDMSVDEIVEELEGHGHHDHEEGEEEHDHDHEEEEEYDEHVWLSLVNTKFLCGKITDALCEIDSANADTYKTNFAAFSAELDALHSDFQKLADAASVKTIVFGDRFPFRYFVDDYGLDYFAAFSGCSAETEASFETVIFLAQKMDELGCKTIYTIENSDKSIAQTIISSTQAKDQTVAELNSLQSISRADIDAGVTYISLMRGNYNVLAETLK